MFDPDHIFSDRQFRQEQLLLESAWRFQIVAALVSGGLDRDARSRLRKELVQKQHVHPFRGPVTVSARTIRRWCHAYRQRRLDGLRLRMRIDAGRSRRVPAEALQEASRLFREDPRRSIPALIRLLAAQNPDWAAIKRTTLGRHLRALGLRRDSNHNQGYVTFEAPEGNRLWQGDVLHGPKALIDGKLVTAKIVSWLDDYSRYVVHLQAFDNERLPVLEESLTRAIAKHGKPDAVLVDNGKIYSGHGFTLACSQLGIHKIHSAPYHPESKGKQERFFRTLREQVLNEIENVDPMPLERLNGLLESWLRQYHQTKHSKTEQEPQQRYADAKYAPVPRELLEEAFLQWNKRKVSVQGIISFGGQDYHVDPSLAGLTVIVRYNAFDLSAIYVWRDGRKLCRATPETLVCRTLARRPKPADSQKSTASQRYLEALERSHQRNLESELNLLRFEEEENE